VLRPLPGRRLPRELRPRHVGRLASQYPAGVRDPLFEGLVRRIDGGAIHADNRIELYRDGEQAFAAMLSAIDGAGDEVLLESYIFRDDATGRRVNGPARRAGQGAGRRHRLAQDPQRLLDLHARGGVRMPPVPSPAALLLGAGGARPPQDPGHRPAPGVHRRDEYGSGLKGHGGPWRDTHARVEGTAAWEMAAVFSEGWERAGGRPLRIEPTPPFDVGDAKVLVLDSRPGRGHVESASVITAIAAAAQRRLWITNAYFAPHRRAIASLVQAHRRGVDVRLLLPRRTDAPIVRHAGHGSFRRLLAGGVRVFEYLPAILHAKTLVADEYVAVVGSSNLDFRSFGLNGECNLVILDEATGAALAADFEQDLAHAEEITGESWRRRTVAHRVGDRLARLLSPLL
jgi:cardiolipin synthase